MSFDFKSILHSFFPLLLSIIPIVIVIFIVVMIINFFKAKIHIKWRTFKGKSFKAKRGDFGLYVYCGKQGTG